MAVVALASQSAQAATTSQVTVPFSFTAEGKTCPAGLYTVRTDAATHLVTFENKSASRGFMWLIGPGIAAPRNNKIVLKFDAVNDTHVLHSVQVEQMVTGKLDKTKPSERISGVPSTGR
jgi:hypothetical protein